MSDTYREKIDFVANANQALVHVESIAELLPEILSIAEEATGAEASSYLEFDAGTDLLTFKVARNNGVTQDLAKLLEGKVTLRKGEGIAGRVVETGEARMVHDVATTKRFSSRVDEATGYHTRSVLCVPVMHMDEILGVIQVLNPQNKSTFDDSDQAVLQIFASLAAVAIVRSRLVEQKLAYRALEAEMELAAKLQARCWPDIPQLEDGCHAWGSSLPAKEVGGDLYDCIPLEDGSYLFYVADVAGKGLAAGFVMATLWSAIRSQARYVMSVTGLLREVNRVTHEIFSRDAFFATIGLLRFWPDSGKLEMASGGHGVPMLHDGERFIELPRLTGLPLGVLDDTEYSSHITLLDPGSTVMLYSDGLNEAFNPQGEMFGLDRAQGLVTPGNGQLWGQRLMEAAILWSGGRERTDDITLLALWRKQE